jgi:two-component system chemotaxis response regulator CheB
MSFRILIADDSAWFRHLLTEILGALPNVEVVGAVSNGRLALQRVRELSPDLLTLDMEMPELDGLGVLDGLKQAGSQTAVIVVSALTHKGGQLTMRALEKGAFDFITKPDMANAQSSREAIAREMAPRVRALANRAEVRNILRNKPQPPAPPAPPKPIGGAAHAASAGLGQVAERMGRISTTARPELVLIGVSTGGPNALAKLLPAIPASIGVPIVIVQHMPPVFTQSLAESLAGKCSLRVREGSHGETLRPGTAYIAPGGRQMRLHPGADGSKTLQITDDPPENNCRPAVDYLFRSAANQYPGRSLAVILTGMGSDGTLGLRLLKRHGCLSIAQDEASCVVYGMPKAAVDAGVADLVLPLDAIAGRILSALRGGGL